MTGGAPRPERDRQAEALHALRPLRLLKRHLRYSAWVLGPGRRAAIDEALTQLYREVNRFLSVLGVPWWICYGTLLGWYRNGGLLRGERDVDFGLPIDAYETVWQARHELPEGFRMFDTSPWHFGPKLYVEHGGWEADLYFYRVLADGRMQSCERSPRQGDVAPFHPSLVHPLVSATFLGEPTWVPSDSPGWLLHTYGCIDEGAVQDRRTGYWHRRAAADGPSPWGRS